jgi:hypothetical protein
MPIKKNDNLSIANKLNFFITKDIGITLYNFKNFTASSKSGSPLFEGMCVHGILFAFALRPLGLGRLGLFWP